jgi:hypothetical protein
MRYRLRTLLILLAVVPPVLALSWRAWHRLGLFALIPLVPALGLLISLTLRKLAGQLRD